MAPPSVPASVVTSGGSSSFGGRAEKYLPPLPLINHGEMKQGRIRELEEFHRTAVDVADAEQPEHSIAATAESGMNFLMQAQSAQLTLLNRRLDEEEARRKAEEAPRTVSAFPSLILDVLMCWHAEAVRSTFELGE